MCTKYQIPQIRHSFLAVSLSTHTHTHTHSNTYTHASTQVHAHAHTHVRTHIHSNTHTYTDAVKKKKKKRSLTHTLKHTHTYTDTVKREEEKKKKSPIQISVKWMHCLGKERKWKCLVAFKSQTSYYYNTWWAKPRTECMIPNTQTQIKACLHRGGKDI